MSTQTRIAWSNWPGPKGRAVALLAMALLAVPALASDGTVALNSFPTIAVADGRSTVTITAEIRDRAGSLAPDGTQVVFDSSLGTFRETVIRTQNGFAQAVLQSSGLPGIARIRASALRFNASATLEVEFVVDRALLSTANEYVELVSDENLLYSVADQVLEASAADRGVTLRYKDIEIRADDLQLSVPTTDVKARRAKLTIGKESWIFEELAMRLNRRSGMGTTVYDAEVLTPVRVGMLVTMRSHTRTRLGLVRVHSGGIEPYTGQPDPAAFKFQEISDSISRVEAKKAVAFPRKGVQFHKANVRVGGVSVFRVPLYQLSTQTATPVVTEQYINVSNNQVSLNYPHYLSLKPGETSLLRLRYGNQYSGGVGASGGTYLDYELKWNRGDEMDGGLTISGLGRNDWGVGLRQFWQADEDTNVSAQLDFPAHKSLYANLTAGRTFDGFQASFSAAHGRSISGERFTTDFANLVVEQDPFTIPGTGIRSFLGLTASVNAIRSPGFSLSSQSVGARARFLSRPVWLGSRTTVNGSYILGYTAAGRDISPITHALTVSLGSTIGNNVHLQTVYDFVDDGFSSDALGKHRLSGEAYYSRGRASMRAYLARSLDADRIGADLSLDYRFSRDWRVRYSSTLDRYQGDSFFDQSVVLAYRVGLREVGLSYSQRTRRLGFEILGATLD